MKEINTIKNFFQKAYMNAPVAIEYYDIDGNIILSNHAAFEMFGVKSIDDISGYNMFDDPNLEDSIKQKFKQEEPFRNEVMIDFEAIKKHNVYKTTKSGVIYLDVSMTPFIDSSGGHIGYLLFLADITKQKLQEKQLRDNAIFLAELAKDKDNFISILGHDLRNPFTSLIGSIELITFSIDDYSKEDLRSLLEVTKSSAQSILKLLNDLLEWSRANFGRIFPKRREILFYPIIEETICLLSNRISDKGISVIIEVANNIPVHADEQMLKTVLRNLISNAIKYSKQGDSVIVSAHQEEAMIVVSVSDTGIGIRPDLLESIWSPYEHNTTRGTAGESGTGFGLKISKKYVELHGGEINVKSTLNKGSSFVFSLPCQ